MPTWKVPSRIWARVWILAFVSASIFLLAGCEEGPRLRPYGVIRLGPVVDFSAPETFLDDKRLMVRHDARGYSVMSTECTYDLAPLYKREDKDGRYIFYSKFSKSLYDSQGNVLEGPSKFPLPFYELEVREGVYGGPRDTLYVIIGPNVGREWRLPLQ